MASKPLTVNKKWIKMLKCIYSPPSSLFLLNFLNNNSRSFVAEQMHDAYTQLQVKWLQILTTVLLDMLVEMLLSASSVSSLSWQMQPLTLICHLVSFGSVTLDTPMNRKFMPDADFSSWTPLEYIAEWVLKWIRLWKRLWYDYIIECVLYIVE